MCRAYFLPRARRAAAVDVSVPAQTPSNYTYDKNYIFEFVPGSNYEVRKAGFAILNTQKMIMIIVRCKI